MTREEFFEKIEELNKIKVAQNKDKIPVNAITVSLPDDFDDYDELLKLFQLFDGFEKDIE